MKKVVTLVLSLVLVMTLMSGCMAQEVEMEFEGDSSGKLVLGAYFSDEFFESMGTTADEAFANGETEGEIVKKEFNGVPYTGVLIEEEFNNLNELREMLQTSEEEGQASAFDFSEYIENGEKLIKIDATMVSDGDFSDDYSDATVDTEDIDMTNLIIMDFSFTFANGVKEVIGLGRDVYEINGNSVKINLVSEEFAQSFSVIGSLGKTDETEPVKEVGLQNFVKVNSYNDNFKDVTADKWYSQAVADVYEYGVVTGTSVDKYSPDSKLTLAHIITMMARVNATYSGESDNVFRAIAGEPYYVPYVNYSIEKGIIKEGDFTDFNREATRAEMAYVIVNTLPESELEDRLSIKYFDDVDLTSKYSDSILKLYTSGITNGTGGNNYSPDSIVTRAQAAVFVNKVINPDLREKE